MSHDEHDEEPTATDIAFKHVSKLRKGYAIGGGVSGAGVVAVLVTLHQLGIIGAPSGESSGSNRAQWQAISANREAIADLNVRLSVLEARE